MPRLTEILDTHGVPYKLASLEDDTSERVIAEVRANVLDICRRYPVYG